MSETIVVIELSPTVKVKAKSLILSLLSQHGIDDETDLNGIEYKSNDNSKFIEKILIKFKNLEGK